MRIFISLVTLYLALVSILTAQWLEATIPVGDNPHTLVYNSTDNKVYCANVFSNNVTVIDNYNSVIKTIPVDEQPSALGYNFLNDKVYCGNELGRTVTVIEGVTDSVLTIITVGIYPEAFVYIFHLPGKGTWCGASPELLFKVIDNNVITDALAGTKLAGNDIESTVWSNKEKEEQYLVAVFIESVLSELGIEKYDESGPINYLAGNLVHLQTKIEIPLAFPVILNGIRIASVEVIASASLAAIIGGGGLGDFIISGLSTADNSVLLVGAIPVSVMAIILSMIFELTIRKSSTRHRIK